MFNKCTKFTSLFIAILMFISLTGCGIITSNVSIDDTAPPVFENDIANREEAYRKIVQGLVNTYGIMQSDDIDEFNQTNGAVGSKEDFLKHSGLIDAITLDITGDKNNELFCVWYDDNFNIEVYEYENGNASVKWSKNIGNIVNDFSVKVYSSDDNIYWCYSTARYFQDAVTTYKDGEYQTLFLSDLDFTKKEQDYINSFEETNMGYSPREQAKLDVCLERFGISKQSDNDNVLLSVENYYEIPKTPDDFISRWDITIPEPELSAQELLGDVAYFGDRNKCKMDKKMAEAYANAIESVNTKYNSSANYALHTYLVDIADDGMPILFTAFCEGDGMYGDRICSTDNKQPMFDVWTYDGTTAQNIEVEKHNVIGKKAHSVEFLSYDGSPVIALGYGVYNGADDGVQGTVYYSVKDGQMTKLHDEMECAARGYGDDIMRGYYIPLSDGIYGEKVGNNPGIPAQKLVDSGWHVIGMDQPGVSVVGYAWLLDGKILDSEDGLWPQAFSNKLTGNPHEQIMEGSLDLYLVNWKTGTEIINTLRSYAKVAGKPSYSYSNVSAILTDAQFKALAVEVAKSIKGEIGEIYKLSDDLYYVIIYTNDEPCGGVIIKNTNNGESWRTISSDTALMDESKLQSALNDDQSKSNIKIDYTKTEKSEEYLTTVLNDIDGTVPNNAAKSELTNYIEACISTDSQTNIKAKNNCVTVTDKTIEKSVENALSSRDKLNDIISQKDIELNKEVTVILHIICNKVNVGESVQITFDTNVVNALGDADSVKLVLQDKTYSVNISADKLRALITQYGEFVVILNRTGENTYSIKFADSDGNIIDKLESGITFTLPAIDELCTVEAEYTGGTDNWGGQFDENNHTISFETPYSGTYTVVEDSATITDIANLTPEQQKAIKFMVSKGYFSVEDNLFNPESTLTRYDFSQALVKMFFALDKTLACNFSDVTKDNPYYYYVASGAAINIIEGYDDGTFKGEKNIIREEMLALCGRTLKNQKGYIEPSNPEDYLHFTDSNSIPDKMRSDIALTVREGLIEDGGMLLPQEEITRAESAEILYKLFMLLYEVEPVNIQKTSFAGILPITLGIVGGIVVLAVVALIIIKRKKSK